MMQAPPVQQQIQPGPAQFYPSPFAMPQMNQMMEPEFFPEAEE